MIDTNKLSGAKRVKDGYQARCPICELNGSKQLNDRHLKVYDSGAVSCVIDKSDQHISKILKFLDDGIASETIYHKPTVKQERVFEEELLNKLVRDFTYWEKRGVKKETIEKFEGGIATTGQLISRWVFPLRNEHNQILAFTGRYILPVTEHTAKWKHLGSISSVIWPIFAEIKNTAILLESPGDTIALADIGIYNCLCMFGLNLSSTIISYLIENCPRKIIISTNNDKSEVGVRAAVKIKRTLSYYFNDNDISIRLPESKDWGCAALEEKESFKKELV